MNLSARSCLRFGLARRLMVGDLRLVGLRIVTIDVDGRNGVRMQCQTTMYQKPLARRV